MFNTKKMNNFQPGNVGKTTDWNEKKQLFVFLVLKYGCMYFGKNTISQLKQFLIEANLPSL